MADDSFQAMLQRSPLVMLIAALVGCCVLMPCAGSMLLYIEHKAINTAASLEQGAALCRSVPADRVDAANDGHLVHVSGTATTGETVTDPEFAVSAQALRLTRDVEVFQWQEDKSEKKKDNKTFVTYTYKQVWSNRKPPQVFAEPAGHTNPPDRPYLDAKVNAAEVKVGAFKLAPTQVDRIPATENLPVTEAMLAQLPAALKAKAKVNADGLMFIPVEPGHGPDAPQVGDARIRFKVARPQPVSLVAKQVQGSFEPYVPEAGENVDLISPGTRTAGEMIEQAQASNQLLAWLVRLFALGIITVAVALIVRKRIASATGTAPEGIFSNIAILLYSVLLAVPLLLLFIGLRWVFSSPLIGGPLLLGGLILLVVVVLGTRMIRSGLFAGVFGGGRKLSAKERELHTQVAGDPENADLRLELATALEGSHDPKGEVIRLTAEAEALPENDPGRLELEDKINALLDQHGKQWFAGLSQLGLEPMVAGYFYPLMWMHHGVMDEVLIDRKGILPEQADRLFAAVPGLRILTFNCIRTDINPEKWDGKTYKPNMKAIVKLPQLRQIGVLRLSTLGLTHDDLEAITAAPNLQNLVELEIGDNKIFDEEQQEDILFGTKGAAMFARSGTLLNLRVLDLNLSGLKDKGTAILVGSENVAQLTTLNLGNNEIGPDGAAALATSPHLARLRTLNLRNNTIGRDGMVALAASPVLTKLTALDLSSNLIAADTMAALARSAILARMKNLDLSSNVLRSPGLRQLAKSPHFGRLEVLNLENNEIDSDGAIALAACESIKRLRELTLSYNKIDDAGFAAIANAPGLGYLKKLSLRDNKATAAGIKAIAESPYLDELEELDISGNEVGLDGARALAGSEILGKLKVLHVSDAKLDAKAEQILKRKFGDKAYC